jgi:hypothetical protein
VPGKNQEGRNQFYRTKAVISKLLCNNDMAEDLGTQGTYNFGRSSPSGMCTPSGMSCAGSQRIAHKT